MDIFLLLVLLLSTQSLLLGIAGHSLSGGDKDSIIAWMTFSFFVSFQNSRQTTQPIHMKSQVILLLPSWHT